ncbi:ABC transporter ATP-binding protein [Clostridium sp. D53t1_180928_C8]|uniref:ABC transporter ATP-binding protein n=1 Tax=Clostridium sp. D53t1_180928_C8 TaxID=2787101 RepID=UPI0018AAFDCE|nr:ABC transporter ATP-binding protein [Clostridium sp. D53t1_180928_C8]
MDNIITLKDINKYYKMGESSLHVLKNITLSVKCGEYIAILGTSGSGKTTLMNILGCMDVADSGEYTINDVNINNCSSAKLAEIRNGNIGFIFQKYHLIPQYNVLENVIMPLLIKGLSRNEAIKIAEEKIKMVGLWERISHKPNELSGGQQQRVAIARALVTNPAILLADEPTGALDSATGKEILELFKQLNEIGNTIIVITHDNKVARESKRVVRIQDGVLTDNYNL